AGPTPLTTVTRSGRVAAEFGGRGGCVKGGPGRRRYPLTESPSGRATARRSHAPPYRCARRRAAPGGPPPPAPRRRNPLPSAPPRRWGAAGPPPPRAPRAGGAAGPDPPGVAGGGGGGGRPGGGGAGRPPRAAARHWLLRPIGCWKTHFDVGCGNFKSECIFLF